MIRRILMCGLLAVLLGWPVAGWATTYYVDQRCQYNGDGLTSTCALSAGGVGALNHLWQACKRNTPIPDGTHTIEVVAGSGPYYYPDQSYSTSTVLYPEQRTNSVLTWNFNKNIVHGDINVNNGDYEWHLSSVQVRNSDCSANLTPFYCCTGSGTGTCAESDAGELYYLTAAGGTTPGLRNNSGYSYPNSVIIDGSWTENSMSLMGSATATAYWYDNWTYGDLDSLGFSTLYIRWSGGNPSGKSAEIWVSQADSILFNNAASGFTNTDIVNDAVFQGGGLQSIKMQYPVHVKRTTFYNSGQQCVQIDNALAAGSTFSENIFDRCGHRGINSVSQASFDAYNNTFNRVHIALLIGSDTAYTINFYNNVTYMLYAGGIQKDKATPVFNEGNNWWNLDSDSTHGTNAIAFTGGTPQWTITAATDFPSSVTTTTSCIGSPYQCGDDPHLTETLSLTPASGLINTGAIIAGIHDQATPATDINGTSVLTIPDIGAYEYPGGLYFNASAADGGNGTKQSPYNAWTDYTWTGYNLRAGAQVYLQGGMSGTLDWSGLTDTGKKTLAVWPGKTGSINGFIGGVNDVLDLSSPSRGLFGTLYGN